MKEGTGQDDSAPELSKHVARDYEDDISASFWRKIVSLIVNKKAMVFVVSGVLIPVAGYLLSLGERAAEQERSTTQTLTQLLPLLGQNSEVGVFGYAVLGSLENGCTQEFLKGLIEERCNPVIDRVKDAATQLAQLDKLSTDADKKSFAEEKLNAYTDVQNAGPQLDDAASSAAALQAPAAPSDVKPSAQPNVVYIQTYGIQEKADAEKVRSGLVKESITTPEIENIRQVDTDEQFAAAVKVAQKNTIDVRYFFEQDASAADWVKVQISNILGGAAKVTTRNLSGKGFGAQQGSIEIWFPCTSSDGC